MRFSDRFRHSLMHFGSCFRLSGSEKLNIYEPKPGIFLTPALGQYQGSKVREPAGWILPPEIHKNTKLRVAAPKKHQNTYIIDLQTQPKSLEVSRISSILCQNCRSWEILVQILGFLAPSSVRTASGMRFTGFQENPHFRPIIFTFWKEIAPQNVSRSAGNAVKTP